MRFLASIIFILLFLFLCKPTLAATNRFVNIVNPIRGGDFWQVPDGRPADNVKKQWQLISINSLSATWLVRPDVMVDSEIVGLLKTFPQSQELGLFMEITPTWAKNASVNYHQNENWHDAGSVFLTGYSVDERHKLIDSAFSNFKKSFGFYPKSVGAWWIDAGSLLYMKDKYGIVANMDVADQYTTDNYQVWGQYFSTPFYPAKRNALVPPEGVDQKIGVVTIQWATRDPVNSYGNGVLDSTYSVQANDYANKKYHNLDTDYFKKLSAIYLDNPYSDFGAVTVGLENDFSWKDYGEEFDRQVKVVAERKLKGDQVLTMSEFANWYVSAFPNLSPPQTIFASDPLGSDDKVVWYQNERYRIGWFYHDGSSLIRDLRLFYNSQVEPCLEKACQILNLAMIEDRNIDEVTYGDRWVLDEGKISEVKVRKKGNDLEISYINQAGNKRTLLFLRNDINLDGTNHTLASTIAEVANSSNSPKIEGNYNYGLKNGLDALLNQFKNLAMFLIFAVFFLYLPGLAVLKKSQLSRGEKFVLSWPIGLTVFTLTAFIFGYLHFYWGILILPVVSILIIGKDFTRPNLEGLNFWTFTIIAVGSLSWLLTTVKNGLLYDFGLGFWGAHGHDAIWHLSLAESVKNGLPLENSIFSGTPLLNYHFFYDLALGVSSYLTKISLSDLYFRDLAFLISISLGLVTYLLAKAWFKSELAANLSLFFLYFGGSFGWMVSYFKERSLGGESLFWAQQGISTLINPPFAISLLTFLAGLYLFHKVAEQKGQLISSLIPLTILWGTLIEFKVYGGILVLGALLILTVYQLLKQNVWFLKISLPIGFLSLIIFLPNNLGSQSLLVFQPFWLIHSMVDSADRLNWIRLSNARILGLEGGNYFKFFVSEVLGFIIFILGNLGARSIGFLSVFRLRSIGIFETFILLVAILSITFPMLFIQKGASFNILQFFYYFLMIFNFLAAACLASLAKKLKFGWVLIGLTVLLTVPTTWDSLHHFIPKRPPAMVPAGEVEGLNFLQSQPQGRVLSYFFDIRNHEKYGPPQPLFAYQSTPYVSAFSGKSEFIADTVNLEILGVDYKGRLQTQKDIFAGREPEMIERLLSENKIKYIYAPRASNFHPADELGLKKIFENSDVSIFLVTFNNGS